MDIQLIALFVAPITSIIALAYGFFLTKKILKDSYTIHLAKLIGINIVKEIKNFYYLFLKT